jgi:hypothetical protein
MWCLKALLLSAGIGTTLLAIGILTQDLVREIRYRCAFSTNEGPIPPIPQPRWRTTMAFALLGWAPIMIALSMAAYGLR